MALIEAWALYTNKVEALAPDFMGPLVAPSDIGINIDFGCGRTVDPYMVPVSSLDQVVAKAAQIDIAPGAVWVHGPKHEPMGQPSPLESAWNLTATGAMEGPTS